MAAAVLRLGTRVAAPHALAHEPAAFGHPDYSASTRPH